MSAAPASATRCTSSTAASTRFSAVPAGPMGHVVHVSGREVVRQGTEPQVRVPLMTAVEETRLWHPFADMGSVRHGELVIERGEDVSVGATDAPSSLAATARLGSPT